MARKIVFADPDDLVRQYLSGKSVNTLSKQFKVSRTAFNRFLANQGIYIRSKSEAESIKWQQMPSQQRDKQVKAAHNAVRGARKTRNVLLNVAQGKFRSQTGIGKHVHDIANQFTPKPLLEWPIDIYNLDIAFCSDSIAVEISCGHGTRKRRANIAHKLEYCVNAGWSVLFIEAHRSRCVFDITAVTKEIILFRDLVRSNPSPLGKYGVIRGDGKRSPASHRKFNHFSRVPGF